MALRGSGVRIPSAPRCLPLVTNSPSPSRAVFSLRSALCLLFLSPLLPLAVCFAQEAVPPATPVKANADGTLEVGGVTLDKRAETVTFPASINMREGNIEYLLVGKGGKTHESLFVTEVQPYTIHLAMLLIGAKGNPDSAAIAKEMPPSNISSAYLKRAPQLKGDAIEIQVRWNENGKERLTNAEDFVNNTEAKLPMARGQWTYNGSSFYHGAFLAQQDRSIAAVILDPEALINNPRPGHDDDQIWEVAPDRTPPLQTPVRITIQIQHPNTP